MAIASTLRRFTSARMFRVASTSSSSYDPALRIHALQDLERKPARNGRRRDIDDDLCSIQLAAVPMRLAYPQKPAVTRRAVLAVSPLHDGIRGAGRAIDEQSSLGYQLLEELISIWSAAFVIAADRPVKLRSGVVSALPIKSPVVVGHRSHR